MINIIAAVQKQQQQSGNHPITVHCRYRSPQPLEGEREKGMRCGGGWGGSGEWREGSEEWRSSLMTRIGPDNKRILVFELHTLRAGGPGLLKNTGKRKEQVLKTV